MKDLFENWQDYLGENEESGVDPQRNFKIALDAIKSEGYEHIVNGNTIKVKHDQREEVLDTLLRNLERLGFSHNIDFLNNCNKIYELKNGKLSLLTK